MVSLLRNRQICLWFSHRKTGNFQCRSGISNVAAGQLGRYPRTKDVQLSETDLVSLPILVRFVLMTGCTWGRPSWPRQLMASTGSHARILRRDQDHHEWRREVFSGRWATALGVVARNCHNTAGHDRRLRVQRPELLVEAVNHMSQAGACAQTQNQMQSARD